MVRSAERRRVLYILFVGTLLAWGAPARAQPFLEFDFEDGDLGAFFNPTGLSAILLCPDPIPSGPVTVDLDTGEVLMTNDENLGISLFGFRPSFVEANFPKDTRDYRVRVLVNLESVNELLLYVRARVFVDEATGQIDSAGERGYSWIVVPQGWDPEFIDGMIAVNEWTGCHTSVAHPEWPNSNGDAGRADPGVEILPFEWYWLEVSSQGNDDGGPMLLTGKLWLDGEPEPESPQLVVVDADGLQHTPATLAPEANTQVFFGTSFDLGQQPLSTARVDDLSVTAITGCSDPPVAVTRALWKNRVNAEGKPTAVYEEGAAQTVSLTLSDPRAEGVCAAGGMVRIVETVPAAWDILTASHAGVIDDDAHTITWDVDVGGGGGGLPTLTYEVDPLGIGLASFQGEITEPDSEFTFIVVGESLAASATMVQPVSDFGSIQEWLVLGEFTQSGGANPGPDQIVLDYLTDGITTEQNIRPEAGDQITPDYFPGKAASTGLAPNVMGRNPGDVPTWVEWIDFDDNDDRIDFESVYGDLSDVMTYAVTYLNVSADTIVNFGVSSDDAVHILLDGETLHANATARGALDRVYQDTPLTHPDLGDILLTEGQHMLMVKVFEGGGEHNFRLGFLDDVGIEIPGGPDDIEISLVPEPVVVGPRFVRGDSDQNMNINLTDGVHILRFLFVAGAATPGCLDASDADDMNNNNPNLTDGVFIFLYLFAMGPPPPAPSPAMAAGFTAADCGLDPTPDDGIGCAQAPDYCAG